MTASNNNDRKVLPVPSPVNVESRLSTLTKFLGWLTAALLSSAVLVALLVVSWDRDDLRTQIQEQSRELECREDAVTNLYSALTNELVVAGEQDRIVGRLVVAIGQGEDGDVLDEIIEELEIVNQRLTISAEELEKATERQEQSIDTCQF